MTQSYVFLINPGVLSSSIMGNSNCVCIHKGAVDQPQKRKAGSLNRKDSYSDKASIASSDIKNRVITSDQATTNEHANDKPKTEEHTDADKSNTSVSSNCSSVLVSAEEETQENIKQNQ